METGKIHLSCGHEDKWRRVTGWPVYYKDFSERGNPCIGYATMCFECYISFLQHDPSNIFMSWNEAESWLGG
jgi:hypothetical protein